MIVIVVVGFGVWYWQNQKAAAPVGGPGPQPGKQPDSLGAQIFEKTQNPTKDQFPESNPFAADTNPFDVNANPFKDTYKNPF